MLLSQISSALNVVTSSNHGDEPHHCFRRSTQFCICFTLREEESFKTCIKCQKLKKKKIFLCGSYPGRNYFFQFHLPYKHIHFYFIHCLLQRHLNCSIKMSYSFSQASEDNNIYIRYKENYFPHKDGRTLEKTMESPSLKICKTLVEQPDLSRFI